VPPFASTLAVSSTAGLVSWTYLAGIGLPARPHPGGGPCRLPHRQVASRETV